MPDPGRPAGGGCAAALLGGVAALLSAVGTAGIALPMLLAVSDVPDRNLMSAPITGVPEIAGRTVVAIVFLQVSAAILEGRRARADVLLRRIAGRRPRAAAEMEAAFCLTGAAVFALIALASWPWMVDARRLAGVFGVQGAFTIPAAPFRAMTVGGSALAVLV